MRRFELVEGASSKFWEIGLEGTGFTVRYGRIGTQGQSQQKDFPTADKAQVEHDKLVAEKTRKGYAEVGASASAAAPPTAAVPSAKTPAAKAPAAKAPPAKVAPAPSPAPAPHPAGAASSFVATDPSTWPAELAALLHPSRAWPGAPIALDRAAIWKRMQKHAGKSEATEALNPAGYARLASTEPPTELGDVAVEHQVLTILTQHRREPRWVASGIELAVDHWVATAGVAPTVALLGHKKMKSSYVATAEQWRLLARHVAQADEASWNAAVEAARPIARSARAYLFPESGAGDRIALTAGGADVDEHSVAAITSQEALDAFAAGGNCYHLGFGSQVTFSQEPTVLTLVARLGEGVIDPFAKLLDGANAFGDAKKALARGLGLVATPRAFEALVARAGDKHAATALHEAALRAPAAALGPLAAAAAGRGPGAQVARAILAQVVRGDDGSLAAAEAALSDGERKVIAELRAKGGADREEASLDELPSGLAKPRWLAPRKKTTPVVVEAAFPTEPDRMEWPDRLREEWSRIRGPQWDVGAMLRWRAAKEELGALSDVVIASRSGTRDGLAAARPFASLWLAHLSAEVLQTKRWRREATAWLLAHPAHAIAALLPRALGPAGAAREEAEQALRFLAREGHADRMLELASRVSDAAREGARALVDSDPLDLLPAKIPPLPDFASPAALPRPVLRASGKVIPATSMGHLLTMLAISRPDDPYRGVLDLKEVCTPESLADLGWDLFQAWLVAGAPSKEGWAFTQLAFLGDDACARKLAALVRVWPGESAHARAVTGLDVLAAIGTDVALMHVHGIAQKLKFKGLQDKAAEKIEEIAQARGLSAEDLADRLVPDLGLDEGGSLVLDFGPRQFRVGFDEALRPFVRDAAGERLADLPKARKDDDAEKAKEATDRWKALKKDAKTIASLQITRLELAMCGQRRWSEEVFRRFFLDHPLTRHLAVRLVWGAYPADGSGGGAPIACFRVAEDGSLADANDDAWTLPAGSTVGLVHALEIDPADAARFGQTLSDYEILQPFPQLGRDTHALTEAEKQSHALARWNDRKVPTGAVLGLESRGWRRGQAQDGGVIHWFERQVPGSGGPVTLFLGFEPGVIAGAATEWKEQKLLGVAFDEWWAGRSRAAGQTFADLHPIVLSEIVRDVESVVAGGGA